MLRSRSVIAWFVAPWILAACVALAEEKPAASKSAPKDKPAAESKAAAKNETPRRIGQAAIEKALAEPTELEFVETPLTDVIDYLKDHRHIEIQINRKALDEVGIGDDTPVTINLKGVSLRWALNLMLREISLTWTIRDEVLLITTPEDEATLVTTKVYDVSDLVVCRDNRDRLWDDYDTLIKAIVGTFPSETWDSPSGDGFITGASLGKAKVLVVSHTYRVHGEVAELLAGIREMAKKNPEAEPPRRDRPQPKSPWWHGACPMPPQANSNPAAGAGGQSHGDPQAHGRQEGPQARPMGGGMF